jgi:tetratricopeptide (TPR) repeat protein
MGSERVATRKKQLNLGLLLAAVFAAVFLTSVSAISPQGKEYLRKAKVFFTDGDLRMARDYLQRAIKLDPNDPDIAAMSVDLQKKIDEQVKSLRQRADFFVDAKNLPEAEKLYGEVLILASNDEHALAKLKEIKGTYEQIEEYRNQGIEVNATTGRSHDLDLYSAVSLINRARGFFSQGERAKALELVEQVLKREAGYKPALDLKEKILYINQLEAFVEKAETAFLEGRMRETVEALNSLIKDMPDRHEFLLMRAKANLRLKNHQAAVKDLWKYFHFKPEKDVVFPLLCEGYYGTEDYLLAYALATDPQSDEPYKPFGFRLRCHIYAFPQHYIVFAAILALMPFALYFVWVSAEAIFVEKFSIGSLRLAFSCIFTIIFKSPEECLGDLIVVARDLNNAWVNYLTGITLFKVGQIEGAQRFLAYSFTSEAIRPRAYYFFGLTRKLLKHNLYEHDFEESVLSGLAQKRTGWHPEFIRRIERDLLISYSKDKSDETFEGMAFKLVEDATGGLT